MSTRQKNVFFRVFLLLLLLFSTVPESAYTESLQAKVAKKTKTPKNAEEIKPTGRKSKNCQTEKALPSRPRDARPQGGARDVAAKRINSQSKEKPKTLPVDPHSKIDRSTPHDIWPKSKDGIANRLQKQTEKANSKTDKREESQKEQQQKWLEAVTQIVSGTPGDSLERYIEKTNFRKKIPFSGQLTDAEKIQFVLSRFKYQKIGEKSDAGITDACRAMAIMTQQLAISRPYAALKNPDVMAGAMPYLVKRFGKIKAEKIIKDKTEFFALTIKKPVFVPLEGALPFAKQLPLDLKTRLDGITMWLDIAPTGIMELGQKLGRSRTEVFDLILNSNTETEVVRQILFDGTEQREADLRKKIEQAEKIIIKSYYRSQPGHRLGFPTGYTPLRGGSGDQHIYFDL